MEYRESQKFNQWWMWLINFVGLATTGWASYTMFNSEEGLIASALPVVITVGLMIMLALMELRTTITEDGIEVKFWPFSRRRIFRSEIKSARVRKYSPVGEYGGWGYRTSLKNGKAYNMMGSQGLQLELHDGEKILIGTQQPEELAAFISAYLIENDVLTDEAVTLKLRELRENKLER